MKPSERYISFSFVYVLLCAVSEIPSQGKAHWASNRGDCFSGQASNHRIDKCAHEGEAYDRSNGGL